jgi:hypothetical protein
MNQKITPAMAAKIRASAAEGRGASEIARELGGKVSRQAVSAMLAKSKSKRTPAVASMASMTTSATVLVPEGSDREFLRSTANDLRAAVRELAPGLRTGDVQPQGFRAVLDSLVGLVERLDALDPPPPPDPALDPFNLEARRRVVSKLDRAVRAAEQTFKCAACGESPYPRKVAS